MRNATIAALTMALVAAGTACADNSSVSSRPDAQLPVRSLAFIVEARSRAAFLENVEVTASSHGLEYRTAQVSPDGVHWIVEMVNADFRILVVNDLKPEEFSLRAYEHLTLPMPLDRLESFLAELRRAVQILPGVKIMESIGGS